MSTESKKDGAEGDAPAAPPAARCLFRRRGGFLKILLPAALAAAAAYGGTRAAGAQNNKGGGGDGPHIVVVAPRPPGPTLPLEPFLVTLFDTNKRAHPMKMTIAVEFDPHTKEELKNFTPRVRDAVLAHVRTLAYENVTDAAQVEKLRAVLLEKCRHAGAATAERILVTDFVVQ